MRKLKTNSIPRDIHPPLPREEHNPSPMRGLHGGGGATREAWAGTAPARGRGWQRSGQVRGLGSRGPDVLGAELPSARPSVTRRPSSTVGGLCPKSPF